MGERLVMSLPNVYCTRERFLADLYEGKEALARRQSALLWSMTQMMHRLFWEISRDYSYTYEQKIEILKADDALTELITGEKPNFFHCKLSVNAATEAELYLKIGDKERALEMLWSAYDHAESYINRPTGEKYVPCWLSEMDDDQIKVLKMDTNTNFDTIYNIITKPENKFCELFEGNERFEKLLEKLKEKICK